MASGSPLKRPPGFKAILEDRVVEAGGDPDEVSAWVRGHGGLERVAHVQSQGLRAGRVAAPPPQSYRYYVVPMQALDASGPAAS